MKAKYLLLTLPLILAGCSSGTTNGTSEVTPTTSTEQEQTLQETPMTNGGAFQTPITSPEPTTPSGTSSASVTQANGVITVKGMNYSFDVAEIRTKVNQKVTVDFVNTEGTHDFIIDEFKVNTGRVKEGESKTVTFTPTKKGTYEYYCSVGNHRVMGMKGKLIVE
jgi:plastocyanin